MTNWTKEQPTEPGIYFIRNWVAVVGNHVLSRSDEPLPVLVYEHEGTLRVAWSSGYHKDPISEEVGCSLTANGTGKLAEPDPPHPEDMVDWLGPIRPEG